MQAGSRGNFGLVLGIARDIEGAKLKTLDAEIEEYKGDLDNLMKNKEET